MPSSEVLHKFKKGTLTSGSPSGPKVKSRDQAIAIMMSEKRVEDKHGGKYPETKRPKKKKNMKHEAMLRRIQG